MTIRERALQTLWHAQRTNGGKIVAYRSLRRECSLVAVPAQTVAELDLGDGVIRTAKAADWIVKAADLVLDNQPAIPQVGDRIVDGATVYEVMSMTGGQHYEQIGMTDLYWRIHTREVSDV
jgi:hypothetical protein